MKEYQVVGRKSNPTNEAEKKIYRMRIFAANKVIAKSRFWYFLSKMRKMKAATGEILACQELTERRPNAVKNFAIFLRYNSLHGTHNIYKEYRDVSRCGAVKQMYCDMASHHGARATSIQIIDVKEIAPAQVRRKATQQFLHAKIHFPLIHRRHRQPKALRKRFLPFRPTTY